MDANKLNKLNTSIGAFFIFTIVGAILRFFIGPIEIFPLSNLLHQIVIFAVPFGILAAILAYFFPRAAALIISLVVGLGDN